MKKLLIVIAMVVLVVAGNWVYGNILSQKIENRLIHFSKNLNDQVNVQFDHIHVNPLLSKLHFNGLLITTVDGKELASGRRVVLDMPYHEAIRLLNSKKVEELKSLKLHIQDLTVMLKAQEGRVSVKNLVIDFDGHLRKDDIVNLQTVFPEMKQRIDIEAEGVNWQLGDWTEAWGGTPGQKEQFSQVDQLKFQCQFNPADKQAEIIKLQLDAPYYKCHSKVKVTYEGDGLAKVKITQSDYALQLDLKENGLEWGDASSKGKYKVANLSLKTDAAISYKDSVPFVQSHNFDLELDNLTLEYAGKKKAQLEAKTALLGLKMDKLSVKKLSLHSGLEANVLEVKDSELESSILDMSLKAKVYLVQSSIKTSRIDAATLTLSHLAPGIQNGLSTFELMTGQSLPRQGDAIVLEMSGALARPTIKGLRY